MCEAFFIWFSHCYSGITEVLPGGCLGQGVGSPSLPPLSYPQGWGTKGEASPDDAWIFCCAPPFLSFGGQSEGDGEVVQEGSLSREHTGKGSRLIIQDCGQSENTVLPLNLLV